jgi:hypothetical protein
MTGWIANDMQILAWVFMSGILTGAYTARKLLEIWKGLHFLGALACGGRSRYTECFLDSLVMKKS